MRGFGVIQNNIALKQVSLVCPKRCCFGVIQNNIALKLNGGGKQMLLGFGVIQNNIALKPQMQKIVVSVS